MIKHALFWIVILFIAIFLGPIAVTPITYQYRMHTDMAIIEHTMGDKSASRILDITERTYKYCFEDNGFKSWAMATFQTNPVDAELNSVSNATVDAALSKTVTAVAGDAVAASATNYPVAFFLNLYELVFRVVQLGIWVLYALPFIIAAIFDGLMARKVKMTSFQYTSPSVYNALSHLMIAIIFCSIVYFNLPVVVFPIFFPIFVGLFALTVRGLVANLQKSA